MLHKLFAYSILQYTLAPFLAALLTAELLQRLRLSGLALLAGLGISLFLIQGFDLQPLNSPRKVIWLLIGSGLVTLPMVLLNWNIWRLVLTILAAVSAIWAMFGLISHHPLPVILQYSAGCALLTGWVSYWMDEMENMPVQASSAAMGMMLMVGLALLTAGFPLLAKLNLAGAAAISAFILIMAATNNLLACERIFTLPATILPVLSLCLVILSGKLPWYAAIPAAVIPLAARIPLGSGSKIWLHSILQLMIAVLCGAAIVIFSWQQHGIPAF